MTIVVILLSLAGNGLIYAGLAFVNGQLLPDMLAPVYERSGDTLRMLAMTLLFALPGNWLIARGLRLAETPTDALAAVLSTLVAVQLLYAALLGSAPSWRALAAGAVMIAAAIWFAYEQHA